MTARSMRSKRCPWTRDVVVAVQDSGAAFVGEPGAWPLRAMGTAGGTKRVDRDVPLGMTARARAARAALSRPVALMIQS